MTADRELQERVLRALDRESAIAPASIGVTVRRGIVTLMGQVATLQERWAAERVADEVPGVRAIANDLEVNWNQKSLRTSTIIAEEAACALSWAIDVPLGAVRPTVASGWITLAGMVDREYQRFAAERAVRHIAGVTGVSNVIGVREPAIPAPHVRRADVQYFDHASA